MSLQKKCLTASAITHGLLVLIVFVGSAFIPHKPKMEGPEFEIFALPSDFDLVAQDNVFSGGDPNARKGSGIQQPQPQPQPAPPAPTPEQKVEIPQPKPETKPETKAPPEKPVEKPVEKPKPVVDPDAFDLSKAKQIKPKAETKPETKPEPKIDFKAIQALSQKKTITTSGQNAKPSNNTETKLALNSGALADLRKTLQSGLSPGGSPSGTGNIDDILGPGGNRSASYSLYLAGIYRSAWVTPTKSSARKAVRVRVTISKAGEVIGTPQILDRSGDRDFDRAADATVARVKRFDRPPPISEPSVTYTLEFIPPE